MAAGVSAGAVLSDLEPLFYFTTVLFYYCISILLYYYTTILLYYYTTGGGDLCRRRSPRSRARVEQRSAQRTQCSAAQSRAEQSSIVL